MLIRKRNYSDGTVRVAGKAEEWNLSASSRSRFFFIHSRQLYSLPALYFQSSIGIRAFLAETDAELQNISLRYER
jgi:hypothetical protein